MEYYYALTVNTNGNKHNPTTDLYNYTLDVMEKDHDIVIFPRMYEYGKINKQLHVHCLVTSKADTLKIKTKKKYRIHLEKVYDKRGWLNYCNKERQDYKPMKRLF